MTGTLADGAPCKFGTQCQSGFCQTGGQFCGHCSPKRQAGEHCDDSFDCSGTLVCSAGHRCAAILGEGSPCTTNDVCKAGLSCTGGTCVKLKSLGESCDPSVNNCSLSEDVSCDYFDGGPVCGPARYAQTGETCLGADRATCTGAATCHLGTCVGPAGDGEPCDLTADLNCMLPAQCGNGRCELPPPAQDCR
jgi:hypothetical protein